MIKHINLFDYDILKDLLCEDTSIIKEDVILLEYVNENIYKNSLMLNYKYISDSKEFAYIDYITETNRSEYINRLKQKERNNKLNLIIE